MSGALHSDNPFSVDGNIVHSPGHTVLGARLSVGDELESTSCDEVPALKFCTHPSTPSQAAVCAAASAAAPAG